MGALRDAINAKATPNQRAYFAAEDWCKANPGWVRICDIHPDEFDAKCFYSWDELPDSEKSIWVRNYHDDAEDAWREYAGERRYKVQMGFIMDDGSFLHPHQWLTTDLSGRGFMQVFLLADDKVHYPREDK